MSKLDDIVTELLEYFEPIDSFAAEYKDDATVQIKVLMLELIGSYDGADLDLVDYRARLRKQVSEL